MRKGLYEIYTRRVRPESSENFPPPESTENGAGRTLSVTTFNLRGAVLEFVTTKESCFVLPMATFRKLISDVDTEIFGIVSEVETGVANRGVCNSKEIAVTVK